jgi:predicted histone-like DNA-binding protein
MAVKLKKIQRRNPMDTNETKWYLVQERAGTVGIQEIAKEIEGRSSLSLGDVQSVLSNLVEIMPLFLKLGQTIKLGSFGSFHISITSNGTGTADEISGHDVKAVKILFRPGVELKRNIQGLSFEIE